MMQHINCNDYDYDAIRGRFEFKFEKLVEKTTEEFSNSLSLT